MSHLGHTPTALKRVQLRHCTPYMFILNLSAQTNQRVRIKDRLRCVAMVPLLGNYTLPNAKPNANAAECGSFIECGNGIANSHKYENKTKQTIKNKRFMNALPVVRLGGNIKSSLVASNNHIILHKNRKLCECSPLLHLFFPNSTPFFYRSHSRCSVSFLPKCGCERLSSD